MDLSRAGTMYQYMKILLYTFFKAAAALWSPISLSLVEKSFGCN